jgi:hypothetical protein
MRSFSNHIRNCSAENVHINIYMIYTMYMIYIYNIFIWTFSAKPFFFDYTKNASFKYLKNAKIVDNSDKYFIK